MRRKIALAITLVVGLLVVIGGAMAFMLMRRQPEWTSRSPEAIREFNAGMEAERKFYLNDARKHFERALELDPNFMLAKLRMMDRNLDSPEALAKFKQLLEEASHQRLNERERFMVSYALALFNQQKPRANEILEEYVREHPDDPIGLSIICAREWEAQNWSAAERYNKRLLEVDPNWVIAQNHLGYIAMAQGRFKDSEEMFRMYRYIAPDQANPHDSLGELFIVMGRYQDAEKELNEALAIRSDFCHSYEHLHTVAILEHDYDKAEQIAARAEKAGCKAVAMRCSAEAFRHFQHARWDQTLAAIKTNECHKKNPAVLIIGYAAALASDRREEAEQLEKMYRDSRSKVFASYHDPSKDPMMLHIEGVKLAYEGQFHPAAEKLQDADHNLAYWGASQAIFKLYNRLVLAKVFEEMNRKQEARKLVAEVEAVNPRAVKALTFPFGGEGR